MTRSGFSVPRLRQLSLDAPGLSGLPAVSTSANVAEQVRDVLQSSGQAAYLVGRQTRIASAEEDEQNRGVAYLQAQRDLAPIGTRIEEKVLGLAANGGDISDEALSGLVESEIGSGLGSLSVNEAGVQQYRSALTGQLTGVAFRAREQAVQKARADSISDASNAFAGVRSADDYARVSASIRAIDPNLSESEIRSRAVPAMQAAAQTGDRAAFEALAGSIGDSPETRVARWHLANVEQAAESDKSKLALDAAQEVYASYLNSGNFTGARSFLEKAAIPSAERLRLMTDLDVREKRYEDEQQTKALDELGNTLTRLSASGDEAGFQSATERAFASGLVGETDVAKFNAGYGTQLARTLESRAQVSVNALKNATTDDERRAAFASVQEVLAAADAGVAREPGTLGRIEQDAYSEIVRIAEPVLAEMQNEDFRQQAMIQLLGQSDSATGAVFADVNLPGGGVWKGTDQAKAVADAKWQMISATTEDPAARLRTMTDWLARNPAATWSDLERQYQGFVGRAFGSAMNPDQPERLAAVKADIANLASVYQANPEVARRHVPKEAQEFLDFVSLIGDVIPLNDNDAIAGALANIVKREGPVQRYVLSADDRKTIDSALANQGYGDGTGNILDIRREAYAKAEALANVFPTNMDAIAGRLSEYYRANWKKSDGWAVKVGDVRLAETVNYDIVSKAAKGVWLKSNKSDLPLVLKQDPLGAWRLYERGSVVPVEGSPNWNGDDLRRISQAYVDAGRVIAERRGRDEAGMVRARRQAGPVNRTLSDVGSDDSILGLPAAVADVALESFSRMVSSSIMSERHRKWTDQFIENNRRGRDEYEQYVLDLYRSNRTGANLTGAMTAGN